MRGTANRPVPNREMVTVVVVTVGPAINRAAGPVWRQPGRAQLLAAEQSSALLREIEPSQANHPAHKVLFQETRQPDFTPTSSSSPAQRQPSDFSRPEQGP